MRLFFIGCAVTLWPSRTATNGPATQSLGRLGDGRLLEFVRNICLICLSALGRRFRDKSEAKFEGRTLTYQTTLDVTRYARLWRLTWWTQHVAWPLATFGAVVILYAIVLQASGQLDDVEKSMNNSISLAPEYTEAERQFVLAFVAAEFRLARESLGPGLPWAATLVAAFLFELVVYLLGCGRLRLRLLSWSLAGLIVMAAVSLLGLGYGLNLAAEGGGFAPEHIKAQMLLYPYILIISLSALVLCFVSLVLLALRGIAIVLLWQHRLSPELV